MDALTAYGWQGAVLFAWVALCIGSFLNVVIYRLPIMLEREWRSQARELLEQDDEQASAAEPFNLLAPRSRCSACGHQIKMWENIPILSWLFLGGKCSNCKTAISIRYPAVELFTALASVVVIMWFGFTWLGLYTCLFTWMLISLTCIDYDTKLLPDQITYPLLWLGLMANTFTTGLVPIQDAIVGAIAGYLVLWSTYWGFKLVTGKEGMGYGDFKLLAALGAWLGWQALPGIILIAAASGLLYALGRILLARQSSSEPIPFGPFLAIAGWVSLLFRDNVLGVLLP